MRKKIPYFSFKKINSDVRDNLNSTFLNVLDSDWYILGEHLRTFETNYAAYVGTDYAVGVGNGLDALRISLEALDLQRNDEVILPSLTFVATLLAVIQAGGNPVLADVDPETCLIDPQSILDHITKRTKVIVPVHLYGTPCNMSEIIRISSEQNIFVVEDYAQAVGAKMDDQRTGSVGLINAASFYPTKTLGALGDGGIITTNDSILANRCRLLRNYGLDNRGSHRLIGYNSRLDELQAAFLQVRLSRLDHWIRERAELAAMYQDNLRGVPGLKLLRYTPSDTAAYHIFPIRIQKRDQLKTFLRNAGIETMVHYPQPLHLNESMQQLGYVEGSFPLSEEIARTELSLPIYPGLALEDVTYITGKIREFLGKYG